MLKKVLLGVSLAVASVFANGFFVGVSGGYGFAALSKDTHAPNAVGIWMEEDSEIRFNAPSYGAKLGYEHNFTEQHGLKAYLDYSRAASSKSDEFASKLSYDIASINADYHFHFLPEFSAFVGLSVGYNWASSDGLYGNESDYGFGANVGVDYDITDFLEIEAKFRYFDSNLPEKTFQSGTAATKVEPDDFSQIMLGVTFKF